jgi:hypothetical protein
MQGSKIMRQAGCRLVSNLVRRVGTEEPYEWKSSRPGLYGGHEATHVPTMTEPWER